MYMRVVQIKINPEKLQELTRFYESRILPELQKSPGCLCASLLRSDQHADEYVSMTLWDSREHAEGYERGLFHEFLTEGRAYLADSSSWKIQLSEDFTLEYAPVEVEPVVKSYPIVAQSGETICAAGEPNSMYMRVVSAKIRPGKLGEFSKLYEEKIMPTLRSVKGCRYAYLTGTSADENEVISVTLWDSREDAENYERSGIFDALVQDVKHTFSDLYQWKMTLEKDYGKKVATSEDLSVSAYSVVSGKHFQ